MILLLAMACSTESEQSPEWLDSEKQVVETITAISNTISKNETELADLEAKLDALKSKNRKSPPSVDVDFQNCSAACEVWRSTPETVSPKVRAALFNQDATLYKACKKQQQSAISSKNAEKDSKKNRI